MKTTTKAPAKKTAATKTAAAKTTTAKTSAAKTTASKTPATPKGTVKAKSTAAEGLGELFEDGLKDIYWAEKALTKALPKMAKNATSAELVTALQDHLTQTETHVQRLEQVFAAIGQKAVAKKCDAMDGLIKEGEGIMEETELGVVRDAGIIAASQKIEHYEIATYGTLAAFAKTLGHDEALQLLVATLDEEKQADALLTQIAESHINLDAADEDME
ncbi:hypothetical protein HYN48_09535 [Flavobacterium magnum]|uniref:Uncharacterized protein n=1 Tax=Flavobacterium magnum TaxID=2162713 RepID=A0A2S0RF52_9FLAO|nr:ferritin-like domain-containing protein [Flavobacterium magnum]AWA30306.1 hypothetical protein HYN48_09535 [Flavobacterium magnum]